LIKLAKFFLYIFKNNIIGLKIICSGKWKKTRSGRKQKLCIRFGKIQRTKIVNTLFYHFLTQKTKYGSFGIKIWVAHKTVYNS
jgi:ribosomal protein S3